MINVQPSRIAIADELVCAVAKPASRRSHGLSTRRCSILPIRPFCSFPVQLYISVLGGVECLEVGVLIPDKQ
jgi:hypothetical protein